MTQNIKICIYTTCFLIVTPAPATELDIWSYQHELEQLLTESSLKIRTYPSLDISNAVPLSDIADPRLKKEFSGYPLNITLPTAHKDTLIRADIMQLTVVWQELTLGQLLLHKLPELYRYQEMIKFSIPYRVDIPQFFSLNTFTRYLALFQRQNEDLYNWLQKTYSKTPFDDTALTFNIGSGEASCGYHAIFNVYVILRALQENRDLYLFELMNITYHMRLFGGEKSLSFISAAKSPVPYGTWRIWMQTQETAIKHIGARSEAAQLLKFGNSEVASLQLSVQASGGDILADTYGEWLTIYGIEALVASLYNPSSISPHAPKLSSDTPIFVNKLPDDYKRHGAFGLILNSKQHWYGVVVYQRSDTQNKDLSFIIVDSKNIARYQDPAFLSAVASLFHLTKEEILKHIQPFKTFSESKITNYERTQRLYAQALQYYKARKSFDPKTFSRELSQAGWTYAPPTLAELSDIQKKIKELEQMSPVRSSS